MVQERPEVDPGPSRLEDLVDQLDKVQDIVGTVNEEASGNNLQKSVYSRWNVKWITGTSSGSPYISVVYEQNWLKFCFQAHFVKIFGHTKFQLSISCTSRAIKLLVEITKYLH